MHRSLVTPFYLRYSYKFPVRCVILYNILLLVDFYSLSYLLQQTVVFSLHLSYPAHTFVE